MPPTSESEQARRSAHPQPTETIRALVRRVVPTVQTRRATAYSRLHDSLRQSFRSTVSSQPEDSLIPNFKPTDYASVCAHVTEDLKLASETIMELRAVLAAPDCRYKGMSQLKDVVTWLDNLQDLEERKLVATVSMHALKRSAEDAKAARYARELNGIDSDINELLEEVREFYVDEEEGETG